MNKKQTLARLKELKKYAQEITPDFEAYGKIKHKSTDVVLILAKASDFSDFIIHEVLTPWNQFRLILGKPSSRSIAIMKEIGSKFNQLGNEVGVAWHYSGNQLLREEMPSDFRKGEKIYANSRDNFYTLSELNNIGFDLEHYYGSHDHILSDRGFKWANLGAGFALG